MTDYQKKRIEELKDKKEENIIYSLWSNDFGEKECFGYFKNYDNAFNLGLKLQAAFDIYVDYILDAVGEKGYPEELDDDEQKYTPNCNISVVRYSKEGEVANIINME